MAFKLQLDYDYFLIICFNKLLARIYIEFIIQLIQIKTYY